MKINELIFIVSFIFYGNLLFLLYLMVVNKRAYIGLFMTITIWYVNYVISLFALNNNVVQNNNNIEEHINDF